AAGFFNLGTFWRQASGCGGTGMALYDSAGSDAVYATAEQADGKLLAAGSADGQFAVARYDATGALDPSFATGGIAAIPAGLAAFDLVIQTDGKIVAVGVSGIQVMVARFDDDGSLDPGFGSGGTVLTTIQGN